MTEGDKKKLNLTIYLESLMEERAMQISKSQKRWLKAMVANRPLQMSENSRRYAKAIARKILDERARKKLASLLSHPEN